MMAKGRQKATDCNEVVEVGEIDTSAPFQSVKDAVTLFDEGSFSGGKHAIKKVKPHSTERVLANETLLHLREKELNKLKEQLKNAETTKAQALVELESAKKTLQELNDKLKAVNDSKDSAVKVSEMTKNQTERIEEVNFVNLLGSNGDRKQDLENAREQYMVVFTELDAAKQELRKIRQDCNATLEAKIAAINQVAEAEHAAGVHMGRINEISKEISAVQVLIGEVTLASLQAQQEQSKMFSEKDIQKQSYQATFEESTKKLYQLKNEFDPESSGNLELQLAETVNEIGVLQRKMENQKASNLISVKTVTSELDDAKESLQKVAEEENSLHILMESLKIELQNVRKEHSEVKEKEGESESIAGKLHVKLQKSKYELEECLAKESQARGVSEDMIRTLSQLLFETEDAQREAEEMKNKALEMKKEAGVTKIALEEAENKLRVSLEEAEKAKEAETRALAQVKILTESTNAARTSTSESGAQITLSMEEFESLSRKVEITNTLAEMKVAAAMAQVEAVKASENEAIKKLKANEKEIEDIKAATEEALKRAQMAESAKRAVEGELRRWREREKKKAAEAASRILAEREMHIQSSSPSNYQINRQNQPAKSIESRKLDKKVKSSVPKKVLLPNISGIFYRKKNKMEGGSFLPGEKPV